jgi:hypothetical protein
VLLKVITEQADTLQNIIILYEYKFSFLQVYPVLENKFTAKQDSTMTMTATTKNKQSWQWSSEALSDHQTCSSAKWNSDYQHPRKRRENLFGGGGEEYHKERQTYGHIV